MEAKLKLIADYILERKGVNIQIIAPQNDRQFALMEYLSDIADNYFKTKNYGE